MAKVYKSVNGEQTELWIAKRREVQRRARSVARDIATETEVILSAESAIRTGQARVGAEKTETPDWAAYIEDDRGFGAAMSIEYGHYAGKEKPGKKRGWVEGKFALHQAIGKPFERGPR